MKHIMYSEPIMSISGVRGIIGMSLTSEIALKLAETFAGYCGRGRIVVGRDTRISGEFLHNIVVGGLVGSGCHVVDLGICGSPTTQIMVKKLKADGGIMITASHNPIEWNGLKFIHRTGYYLDARQIMDYINLYKTGRCSHAGYDNIKKVKHYPEAVNVHIAKVLQIPFLNIKALKRRKFKVVLDAVCGVGSIMSLKLLGALGCEIIPLNCEPSGIFPHKPEPVPENLKELSRKVKFHRADIGFANDPDNDRLAIVSEKGKAIGEEYTLAMAVDFVLSKNPGNVFTNYSTSRMIEDIAEKYGCKTGRTAVGEVNVTKKMLEGKGVIGGEGNGGVMLPFVHTARDALTGMALILQYLLEQNCSLSDIV
ncbi:MAG: phosphoglucosamine mutase, partial [bacterium]